MDTHLPDPDPPKPAAAERPRWWATRPGRGDALSDTTERLIKLMLILVPAGWAIGYLFPPINHDVGCLLEIAHRWVNGERLYVDIIDVNLPLVFALHAIPELLSRATRFLGWTAMTWLTICFYAAIAASFLASRRLVQVVPSLAHPLTEAVVPPTLLFLFIVLPNENFGQREHLLMIAMAPYVLLASARAEGAEGRLSRALVWGVAISAGIALAQKPHFMLIPLAVESYVLAHRGLRPMLRDAVPWLIGAIAAAHLAYVVLLAPNYARFVLPIMLDSYAVMGGTSWREVLLGPTVLPTLLAMLMLGALAIFLSRTVAARVIVAYGVGAALAAAAQAKGWPYHVMPALGSAILLASVTLSQMVDRYLPLSREAHRLPVAAIGATFLILLYFQAALSMTPFHKQRDFQDSMAGVLLHIVERNAPNRTLLILSPGIYPHYPMINYAHARMAMRFQTMWVLQGIYADCEEFATLYTAPEDMQDVERFVYESVSEDFDREKPDLLIIDRIPGIPQCQGLSFSYLEYFQRNARFAQAFERYQHFMDVDRYTIYKRR
ncbi:MAG: hypothetical protein KF889_24815 [Alphaproteobacteria bacterium]|nr:hypothetical protein [Alphaproteobacteria bacterium]MCW5742681.1 hypothetical protein [Alphaproteobacteria bacterium]